MELVIWLICNILMWLLVANNVSRETLKKEYVIIWVDY